MQDLPRLRILRKEGLGILPGKEMLVKTEHKEKSEIPNYNFLSSYKNENCYLNLYFSICDVL